MAIDSARSMKKILRFLVGLLINVVILLFLVKAFTYSFNFAYQVFATTSVDVANSRSVTVEIIPDETLLDVASTLEDKGLVENKYAFILKMRIGGYANQIQSGTYQMAPSNTNSEIIDMITGNTETSEVQDDNG
jgi:cell division protein YceG involved in septum cleavage